MSPLARLCPDCGHTILPGERHHCPASDAKRAAANQRKNARPNHTGVYNTAVWRNLRADVLARADRTCELCGAAANTVDHIEPFDGPNDPLAWSSANLQALCASCHGRKDATRQAHG